MEMTSWDYELIGKTIQLSDKGYISQAMERFFMKYWIPNLQEKTVLSTHVYVEGVDFTDFVYLSLSMDMVFFDHGRPCLSWNIDDL